MPRLKGSMKPFTETIRPVLTAILVWGMAGSPGMALCACDDDGRVEWALVDLSASGMALSNCEIPEGDGQCCSRCDDVPGQANLPNRSLARSQRVTATGVPASSSVPAFVLADNGGFRADLPQQPPPNTCNLRSVVLLI